MPYACLFTTQTTARYSDGTWTTYNSKWRWFGYPEYFLSMSFPSQCAQPSEACLSKIFTGKEDTSRNIIIHQLSGTPKSVLRSRWYCSFFVVPSTNLNHRGSCPCAEGAKQKRKNENFMVGCWRHFQGKSQTTRSVFWRHCQPSNGLLTVSSPWCALQQAVFQFSAATAISASSISF